MVPILLKKRLILMIVLDHYHLKVLNLSLDMGRQYWLVYHREKYQLPVFEKFIDFVGQWSDVKIV